MKIKIAISIFLFMVAIVGSMGVSYVRALSDPSDPSKPAYFWGGTSDNLIPSAYQGAGAFDASGVNVPSVDGDVSGYAWGGHGYGWLSFEDVDVAGCPTGSCDSKRVGNTLMGWARILAIRDAGLNSGGWSGWVSLDGVSVDPSTNNLGGYAWSDELGFIEFSGTVPKPFGVDLTASPTGFSFGSGGKYNNEPVILTWTVEGGPADSCVASSTGTSWNGGKDVSGGSESLVLTKAINTFTITCNKGGDTKEDSVSVSVVCNTKSCGSQTCGSDIIHTLETCPISTCSSDGECVNIKGFKEVVP